MGPRSGCRDRPRPDLGEGGIDPHARAGRRVSAPATALVVDQAGRRRAPGTARSARPATPAGGPRPRRTTSRAGRGRSIRIQRRTRRLHDLGGLSGPPQVERPQLDVSAVGDQPPGRTATALGLEPSARPSAPSRPASASSGHVVGRLGMGHDVERAHRPMIAPTGRAGSRRVGWSRDASSRTPKDASCSDSRSATRRPRSSASRSGSRPGPRWARSTSTCRAW